MSHEERTPTSTNNPLAVVERLRDAINAHDLDAMVDCFAPDFHGETPTFPDNSFVGSDIVRRNWTIIFQRVPNIRFEILRAVVDGDTVWAEVEHTGTETDGLPHHARGVMTCEVVDGRMVHNRLYVGPVLPGPPNLLRRD